MKMIMRRGLIINLRKSFSEVVPRSDSAEVFKPKDLQLEISKINHNLSQEELLAVKKSGADLFLTPEKRNIVSNAGFFYEDANDSNDLDTIAIKGWKLQYLKNMLLLQDYNTLFRDFLQCCAMGNQNGLELTCESRFKSYIQSALYSVVKQGFNLEIDSLKILYSYKVLRMEIYKNLKINRNSNMTFDKYKFSRIWTPLAPLVLAKEIGSDHSIFTDPKPFILATTMLVQTPMKMAVFNQNMTRKVHGRDEEEKINYVVRFETEMNYSDFAWILPTQNKPKRLRSTKITDFNNIMRGNPYFTNKFDLINEVERYRYMKKSDNLDDNVRRFIFSLQ
jgi:hypothetical protein